MSCVVCKQPFPQECERSELARGTDRCSYHAASRVFLAYGTLPAARQWLAVWQERFRHELRTAQVIPASLLTGTILE